MYGHLKAAVEELAAALEARGQKVSVFDLLATTWPRPLRMRSATTVWCSLPSPIRVRSSRS
ncbi:MAG: hypothetical protein ACLU0O_12735 [Collinsella sp.]